MAISKTEQREAAARVREYLEQAEKVRDNPYMMVVRRDHGRIAESTIHAVYVRHGLEVINITRDAAKALGKTYDEKYQGISNMLVLTGISGAPGFLVRQIADAAHDGGRISYDEL